MTLTVVCPLAGTKNSERALPSSFDAARILGADLELFSVVEDKHMVGRRQSYLEKAGSQFRSTGSDAPRTNVVVDPHAPRALAERGACADVVMVMATSSQPLMHAGYLGSAAERVVRQSHQPALLIGPHNQANLGGVRRVVVASDGSSLSEEIFADASKWASYLDAAIWVVTVQEPTRRGVSNTNPATEANYVRRAAERISANWEVLHGHDPARTITDWAGPNSLIAMTSHGRSGFSRLTIGSVATAVTRWATGPVLVGNQQRCLVPDPAQSGQ